MRWEECGSELKIIEADEWKKKKKKKRTGQTEIL